LGGRTPARRAQLGRPPRELRERSLELQLDLRRRLLDVRQALALGLATLRVFEHGSDRATVLALQAAERRETLLYLLEPTGTGVQRVFVRTQLPRQLLPL